MVINRIDIFKFWLFLYLQIIDNSPNFIMGTLQAMKNINNCIKLKILT